MKTRKFTKEQLQKYLANHGSSMAEAARIVGTSTRTLGRYLEKDTIPSEWLSEIYDALRDRKPVVKERKVEVEKCSACGKEIADIPGKPSWSTNAIGLANIGVTEPPKAGWHWSPIAAQFTNKTKCKMYPLCEACHKKLEAVHGTKSKKKVVKAKVSVKKSAKN